jgi:hypothetical protein
MANEYFEMRRKKDEAPVRVYSISPDGIATIFDIGAYKNTGNGWQKIGITKLIPMDMPLNHKEVITKTLKNKAKDRMKIVDATWETSDGQQWTHAEIENAVMHEIELMKNEVTD